MEKCKLRIRSTITANVVHHAAMTTFATTTSLGVTLPRFVLAI